MSNKEWFALAVRIFGVWLIATAVGNVATFFDGKLYPGSPQARDAAAGNLIYATFNFALAAFFLLWTHVVVGWTYGEEREGDRSGDGVVETEDGGGEAAAGEEA
jgi:hypothetical protein